MEQSYSINILITFCKCNVFLNLSFNIWIVLYHLEICEKQVGVKFINIFVFLAWRKPKADSNINILGDTIGALIGWCSAYYLDKIGAKYKWYSPHLAN